MDISKKTLFFAIAGALLIAGAFAWQKQRGQNPDAGLNEFHSQSGYILSYPKNWIVDDSRKEAPAEFIREPSGKAFVAIQIGRDNRLQNQKSKQDALAEAEHAFTQNAAYSVETFEWKHKDETIPTDSYLAAGSFIDRGEKWRFHEIGIFNSDGTIFFFRGNARAAFAKEYGPIVDRIIFSFRPSSARKTSGAEMKQTAAISAAAPAGDIIDVYASELENEAKNGGGIGWGAMQFAFYKGAFVSPDSVVNAAEGIDDIGVSPIHGTIVADFSSPSVISNDFNAKVTKEKAEGEEDARLVRDDRKNGFDSESIQIGDEAWLLSSDLYSNIAWEYRHVLGNVWLDSMHTQRLYVRLGNCALYISGNTGANALWSELHLARKGKLPPNPHPDSDHGKKLLRGRMRSAAEGAAERLAPACGGSAGILSSSGKLPEVEAKIAKRPAPEDFLPGPTEEESIPEALRQRKIIAPYFPASAFIEHPFDITAVHVEGSPELHLPDGQIVVLHQGDKVAFPLGSKIITPERSRIQVSGFLWLEQSSQAEFKGWLPPHADPSLEPAGTIEIQKGYGRFREQGTVLRKASETGVGIITRGTDFAIAFDADTETTTVELYDGEIDVLKPDGAAAKTLTTSYGGAIKRVEVTKSGAVTEETAVPRDEWPAPQENAKKSGLSWVFILLLVAAAGGILYWKRNLLMSLLRRDKAI